MTTALAERDAETLQITEDQLALIKRTVAKDATADELKLYLFDCARQGVHPLDKLVHFTKRAGKYTPITSIDFMRIRAAETGEYAGSDDAIFNYFSNGAVAITTKADDPPVQASVTVWRMVQGQRCSFTATARWSEYKPESNDFMWRKMPHTMLGKCAEALALRKGFPRQLAGLYAKEEMDQAGPPVPVAPDPPATVIDTTTGEVVPAASRPAAPDGYRYIDSYQQSGQWHEFVVQNFDAQGGAMKFATKREVIGAVICQAYQDGIPIRIDDYTVKKSGKGEAYLNKLTVWKPEPSAPVQPMLSADEVF